MNEERKYFGMPIRQVGILAGLVGILVLLVCVGGWSILRNSRSGLSQPPTQAPTPTLTLTPLTAPTITPTITQTPVPYEQLIPDGWVQYKTALVEIWLPPNFKKADPSLLGELADLAVPELVLSEVKSKSSLYNMVAGVSYEPLVGDSFNKFLDGQLAQVPPDILLVERRKISLNAQDVVRLTFEFRTSNTDVNDLTFVFQDGGTIWYVQYIAQINEFYDTLPIFEQSAKTFRIVR